MVEVISSVVVSGVVEVVESVGGVSLLEMVVAITVLVHVGFFGSYFQSSGTECPP